MSARFGGAVSAVQWLRSAPALGITKIVEVPGARPVTTPLAHDATPWEIYDLISGANPKIPEGPLRQIVSSFEEAKFSNHPVTRITYEKMIRAILELERVEL